MDRTLTRKIPPRMQRKLLALCHAAMKEPVNVCAHFKVEMSRVHPFANLDTVQAWTAIGLLNRAIRLAQAAAAPAATSSRSRQTAEPKRAS